MRASGDIGHPVEPILDIPPWVWTAALVALALVAPFFFYPIFLMNALCMALFACAFNLLIGYVGLLSFGHAAYMGMGSYLAAHAAKEWGLPPELAILTGVAVAAVLGLVFGYLAIRRSGIYFAMITLAFAQMVYFFCLQAPFTGGEDGLRAVPRGHLFGLIDLSHTLTMYYFVLAVFLLGFGLIVRTIYSPFGQVLKAIRENEPRAISLGYNSDRYKLMAFVLSAALSGLAGGTKAIVFQFASLTDVFWTMSGLVVLMTLIGGIGTILGPVVGAFVIVTMETYLAQAGSWVTIIQGIIFVICVLTFRQGIVGLIAPYFTGRPATVEPAPEAVSPVEPGAAAGGGS
jgi:branched-chain amino acid transport system permease protein